MSIPYQYSLPDDLLATAPAVPRDSSRLLVYDTSRDTVTLDHFYHLHKYLPFHSFLVMNNTQVLPARVTLNKENGGKVVALLLLNELENGLVKAFFDRKAQVGQRLYFDKEHYVVVQDQYDKYFMLRLHISIAMLLRIVNRIGSMPIPLYLRHSELSRTALVKKYQTVFSQKHEIKGVSLGSVAAPTASLHFTRRVFKQLDQKDIDRIFIQLHVGLGTFAPVSEENIRTGTLHNEYYEISKQSVLDINKHLEKKDICIAVGTTVVRSLESIALCHPEFISGSEMPKQVRHGKFQAQDDRKYISDDMVLKTNLFIRPPYKFKIVDGLITNFHLPGSSLMMLVDAFLQYKKSKKSLLDLYHIAMAEKMRFYSFGDVMLII